MVDAGMSGLMENTSLPFGVRTLMRRSTASHAQMFPSLSREKAEM